MPFFHLIFAVAALQVFELEEERLTEAVQEVGCVGTSQTRRGPVEQGKPDN